ncbi:MAG: type II toxin-antitoxin system VapC family toxin [Bdellovibrionales bacterium]|nr:type II toxin-antitoxin system VapC family toxin [Bdellovibrionales bacterium]
MGIPNRPVLCGMLNLDTHILIDALIGDLSKKEEKALAAHEWCISSIVLWEISKLNQIGRIELDILSLDFSRVLSQVRVVELTPQICDASTRLDFSSDPADELIAATSVVHAVPLVTRERAIRTSKLVPLWKDG